MAKTKLLTGPVPYERAAAFLANKPLVTREAFNHLLPELRARCLAVTFLEDANVLQEIRDRLAEIPRGADWDAARATIADRLAPWLDPDAALKRAELVVRTHAFMAYQAAQHEVLERQQAVFPYWMYQTVGDGNVREAHAALDGLVLPADSAFWKDHYPPWDYGCRCQVVPVTADEYRELEKADRREDDAQRWRGFTLPPATREKLERNGELHLGPANVVNVSSPMQRATSDAERRSAFAWEPGSLRMPLADILGRYDEPVRREFEAAARRTRVDGVPGVSTLWEWGTGPGSIIGGIVDIESARAAFATLGVKDVALRRSLSEREWGRNLSKAAALAHARATYGHYADLAARYPNMPRTLDKLLAVDSKRGLVKRGGGAQTRMATKARPWPREKWQRTLAWEQREGMRWMVEREETQVADNFRHEMGHVLTKPEIAREWRKLYNSHDESWWERNVSHYAAHGQNQPVEGLAETFAMVTERGYKSGTLPREIEGFVLNRMLEEGGL